MTVIDWSTSETEQIVQSATWLKVASRLYALDHLEVRDFMLHAYCEYTTSNKNSLVEARITLNNDEKAYDSFQPSTGGTYRSFSAMGLLSLAVGTYDLALEVKSENANDDISVRRIRLLVIQH